MTAPTLASYGQTTWNNASPKTTSITVAVGDILVVKAVGENAIDFAVSTPTGGTGFTWTLKQSYTANNGNCIVYLWTTVATSAQTFTLTLTRTGQNLNYGCAWEVWRDSGGVGTSGKAQGSGAPSLAITTGGADSAISVVNGDWNAATGTQTARAVSGLTATTTGAYPGDGATYGTWSAAYIGTSAAGSKTVGMTAPAGQQYSLLAVEILGTASSGSTYPVSASASGVSDGSAAAILRAAVSAAAGATATNTLAVSLVGAVAATSPSASAETGAPAAVYTASATPSVASGSSASPVAVRPVGATDPANSGVSGTPAATRMVTASVPNTSDVVGFVDLIAALSGSLSGTVVGVSATTGQLRLTAALSGTVVGQVDVAGANSATMVLAGTAQGHVGELGSPYGILAAGGTVTATGTSAGTLLRIRSGEDESVTTLRVAGLVRYSLPVSGPVRTALPHRRVRRVLTATGPVY